MMMQEELVFIKGKRTKRQRPNMPSPISNSGTIDVGSTSSTTTTEHDHHHDEDMAYCLILLSQGHHHHHHNHNNKPTSSPSSTLCLYQCQTCNRSFPSFQALGGHRASHKKALNNKPIAVNESDHNDHESDDAILSLQLSSSNRPNLYGSSYNNKAESTTITKPCPTIWSQPHGSDNAIVSDQGPCLHSDTTTTKICPTMWSRLHGLDSATASDQGPCLPSNTTKSTTIAKSKVHECSICGAEFTSGQALGGHMRRHRNNSVATSKASTTSIVRGSPESREAKKPRNDLELDLNLPAVPEDDDHNHRGESKFKFGNREKVIVFSASSCV